MCRYDSRTMPPKTAAAKRREMTTAPAGTTRRRTTTAQRTGAGSTESEIAIVVRRGAMRRFDALKTRTSELPVVVTWDRRTDQRRDVQATAGVKRDRREGDRRRTPPFTWELADFV